ncbi:MAG: TolC family protein [Cyclobacteriaceae bacterium]|nr:TolC family protein [Cyclobacteriaceae bacterium]
MRTLLIKALLLLAFPIASLKAQQALDTYIDFGLKNNLVLQQKNVNLDKALLSLKIANGLFSPSFTLLGNYTNGEGGRSISFPVGDMLNPVYNTLNQLTGADNFPQIENVNQNFFPKNFYDVRARAFMPILNTDLVYNRKIKADETLLQEYEVGIYKRELVRNIKVAYFNYLGAREGVAIYQSALTRAEEGKRVNESLLANGKGLPAYLLRSQSEIETIRAQLVDAERQQDNAQLYFNFLLNREGNAEIINDYKTFEDLNRAQAQILESPSISNREELIQIQTLKDLTQNLLTMNKLYWAPRISGFVDAGAQAENLNYNSNANYYLVGLQLEMPLFAGFTNRNKISQSRLNIKYTELSEYQVQQSLTMNSLVSRNVMISAIQNYQSAQKQLEAAQSYQRLIEKGYKEGVNTFIEAVDARNQLTSAQLQVTLNQYRILIAQASYERETAAFEIK